MPNSFSHSTHLGGREVPVKCNTRVVWKLEMVERAPANEEGKVIHH